MQIARILASVVAIAVLPSCGGGESSTPQLRFVVDYLPTPTPVAPAGNLVVSPFAGDRTIGLQAIAKVEVDLRGFPPQVLTAANSEPKDTPQWRWVFAMPATFGAGTSACGTGAYATRVTATDVTGLTLSTSFELCPGTASETSASSS